jgi:hypothetical protein
MLEYSKFEAGERFQRDLYNFVIHVDNSLNPDVTKPAERELILLRRKVQERLRLGKYQLKQSKRFSPADLAGMDYVLFSVSLNRLHFIDVTTDPIKKWQMPKLRRDVIFQLEVDEDETVTLECKRKFLERLLELVTTPSLLTMNECRFPTLEGDISPRAAAAELDDFKVRLKSRVDFFHSLARSRPEQAAEHLANAELIREYMLDIERPKTFAKWEHERQTDPTFLAQQAVLEAWTLNEALNAVRETITPGSQPTRTRQSTHVVEFEERRDQIVLFVQGKRYKLTNITAVMARATHQVWEKRKMRPELYPRKTYTGSIPGLKQSVENLARLIEVTPISVLLGDTFPIPTPQAPVFKPGCKRFPTGQRRAG